MNIFAEIIIHRVVLGVFCCVFFVFEEENTVTLAKSQKTSLIEDSLN